jgi:hypothetical protein
VVGREKDSFENVCFSIIMRINKLAASFPKTNDAARSRQSD